MPTTGILQLQPGQASEPEGDFGITPFTFALTSNGLPLAETTTGVWLVETGSFLANSADATDFAGGVLPSGDFTYAAGQVVDQQFTIPVNGDTTFEPNETFALAVEDSTTSASGQPHDRNSLAADFTILNDDPAPVTLTGSHGQYVIAATASGGALIQDGIAGRDGTQTPAAAYDLSFSDGVGRFDATGNAEVVAHLYQAAFARTADAAGLDHWTAGLDTGQLSRAAVADAFAGSTEFARDDGGDSNAAFVAQLYGNVLGRSGDPAGMQFWTGRLDAGASRGSVLLGFAESFENIQNSLGTTGDPAYGEAYRLYQAALDRTPDAGGLAYWVSALQAGATPQQVAEGFATSTEFSSRTAGLDDGDFVTSLYNDVLGRAGDAAGQQYWTARLEAGDSRASVLLGFSDSTENRVGTASATHDGWVFLGRPQG